MGNDINTGAQTKPSFRWIDNLHILFWLIKDMSWAMLLRPLGVCMIVPTLGVAIYILWHSRRLRAEVYHNAAVCIWISANSLWMILFPQRQEKVQRGAVAFYQVGTTSSCALSTHVQPPVSFYCPVVQ
jgi:hypothetical protein